MSYYYARAEWSDGTSCEGWLRLGDAQRFTEAVTAEIGRCLFGQQAQPGAYTPAALFGASLAADVGAEFVLPQRQAGLLWNGNPRRSALEPDPATVMSRGCFAWSAPMPVQP